MQLVKVFDVIDSSFLPDCICCLFSSAGIEPTGNRVLRPAVFTVDAFSAGQGQVTVYLDHPDGTREEVHTESSFSSSASLSSLETTVSSHLFNDRPAVILDFCIKFDEPLSLRDTWLVLCICVDQLKAEPNDGKKTFSVTYIPQVMGPHKVSFIIVL